MNAKQLAQKHGMLSVEEIDLLQDCVKMLRLSPSSAILLGNITRDEWEDATEEYKKSLLRKAKYVSLSVVDKKKDVFIKGPIIINIGANIGTSACAILEANPQAFIFSIDVKPHPEEATNLALCGLPAERAVRLLGNSGIIGKHFPYDVDMVFVDGAHHDEAVKADIEAWVPRCKSIMLFHDYHHPNYAAKPNANLDQIVDEAMEDWERIGEARYLVAFKRGVGL